MCARLSFIVGDTANANKQRPRNGKCEDDDENSDEDDE